MVLSMQNVVLSDCVISWIEYVLLIARRILFEDSLKFYLKSSYMEVAISN